MKLRIWFGRIIPMAIIVIGEIGLYYLLFKWLTSAFVYIEFINSSLAHEGWFESINNHYMI